MNVYVHVFFFFSAVDEVSGQLHAAAALPREKMSPGGWMGPRTSFIDMEKCKI
jgi:hypothetical protein